VLGSSLGWLPGTLVLAAGPLGISYLIELLKAYSMEFGVPGTPKTAAAPLAAD